MNTPTPPKIPEGAYMVDLYGPSNRWLLSTPAKDRAEADQHLQRVTARVQLAGSVALVQHGPAVVLRAHRGADAWQVVEPAAL